MKESKTVLSDTPPSGAEGPYVTQMVGQFNQSNGNGNPPSEDKDQFFYHPDHLGSTNYVTDYQGSKGNPAERKAF